MKMLLRLFRKLHLAVYVFWAIIFFLFAYPLLYLAAKNPDKHFSLIAKTRRTIAFLSASFSGFWFRFNYQQPIDWNQVYVICANHTSILDISILSILCKQDISFMGKAELLSNPITGIFFRTIDIPVDRSSKIDSYKAFKMAQQRLKEGKSVVIFPEGGIEDRYPPVLRTFKNGAFRLALEAEVPVLPVVIQGAWRLLWDEGVQGSRPGRCQVEVLSPISIQSGQEGGIDQFGEAIFSLFESRLKSEEGM